MENDIKELKKDVAELKDQVSKLLHEHDINTISEELQSLNKTMNDTSQSY
jgi:regulator of replication initiation timing